MELLRELCFWLWLWLWVKVHVALGGPVHSGRPPQPLTGDASYQLVRWPRDFPAAQVWCRRHGGSLLHSWDHHAKDFLQHNLNSGSKSWIGPNAEVLQEREKPRGRGQSSNCNSIIRVGDHFWARKEECSERLSFICQFGTALQSFQPGTTTHPQAENPTDASSTPWRPTAHSEPGTRHFPHRGLELSPQTQPGHHLETVSQHDSSPLPPTHIPSASRAHLWPSTWPQGSPQPPLTPYDGTSTPEAALNRSPGQLSSKATTGGTGTPSLHSTGGSAPFISPDVLSEDIGQALAQMLSQFNQTVQTLGYPLAVERTSQALQDLTRFPALLSSDDQAQASHILQFLSSQLPTEPLASNSSGPAVSASTLFQALSNLLVAMGTSTSSSSGSQQQRAERPPEAVQGLAQCRAVPATNPTNPLQQRETLAETLAALPRIQAGLLLGGSSTGPGVTVESPALSTTISSCSVTSLPHSTFHLLQPKALMVTFPSASSLTPLLNQHAQAQAQVQVQVASFALDPFRPLSGKAMTSVASIALCDSKGPIGIHGLSEEIEITLGGQDKEEGPTMWLNGSAGHFSVEVNVTSLENALLVSVRPPAPLQITLHLMPPPQSHNSSCGLLNTTLPKGRWQEEGAYVWVVPPENLKHGLGTYSVSAEVKQQPLAHGNLSITIASTGCYYWASQHQAWRSDGCRVGPQSTLRSTHCLCSHLSFFGHVLLVLPHTIDLGHTGQLLSHVGQNPAGLALLCSLLLAYGALLLWAWRRQKVDAAKARVTVLVEKEARACCCYLVQVFTGYRRGAATSAQVLLTLYGAEGQSEPHLLQHPQAPGFENGSMDAFLLTTRKPLGNLHAIRLWHDNSGTRPSWFLRRLVVSDLAARKKWYFLCDCWLAADMDDGQVDKVFIPASDKELLSFRKLFWAALVEKLTQEHLWLSVATCSAWSPFTRVQRLSCCLTLLLCSMLINIMFWREPVEEGHAGAFVVTWQQLVVSLQAALLLMPLHLVIVHIFHLVQPPALESPPPRPVGTTLPEPETVPSKQLPTITRIQQELIETVGFLYKNPLCCCQEPPEFPGTWKQTPELVAGLCALIGSYLQQLAEPEAFMHERSRSLRGYLCHIVHDLEARLRHTDRHGLQSPYDRLHAIDQLHRLRQRLEQQKPWPTVEQPSSFPMEAPADPRGPCFGSLPRRFQGICWLLLGTTGLALGFFTVLYSLQLSRAQATSWVVSMVLSMLEGVLFMQPLKVLAQTFILSLMRKRGLWQDKGQEWKLQQALILTEGNLHSATPGSRGWTNDTVIRPPPLKPVARSKERALKEKKMYSLVQEIVVQLMFLTVLMVLCYAERSPSEFSLNDALQKSFTRQMDSIHTLKHLYGWAKCTLLPSIYHDSEGFATDGNSFLVGSVRLRQIRAKDGPENPGTAFLWPQHELYAAAHLGDRGCPNPSWGPKDTEHDRAGQSAWAYQSETALQESPVWGKFALYPGGGYLADLGANASHANSILQALERDKWLDRCTRAIFIEFTVYNANVNLFCVVTVILENNRIGAFASSSALQILRLYPNSQMFVQLTSAKLAFLLLLLYYGVVQGQRMKRQRWRYFSNRGNLLDALTVLTSLTAVGMYVKRAILATSVLRQHRQDRSRFFSISETAKADAYFTYLIAFLVAVTTIKLWNLLRLNPRMHLISRTLQKAWDEILGFLLALLVLLVGYAFACNLLFGWSIFNYKTFFDSVVTIVGLLAGIFNYEAVIALDPVLGSLLIITSVLSMVFVLINLLVSALLTTFSREMKALKVSQEESMIQLIQLKISMLLGIKQRPPVPGP